MGVSVNNAESPWGVILLGHGSQRGSSPRECACAWQQPPVAPEAQTVVPAKAGTPQLDEPPADLPGWPAWCRRCPSTPQGLREVADRLQLKLGQERAEVMLSCLEFIEPFPDEAVRMLSQQGRNRVVVLPYLLGNGKHATVEMDEMLDDVRAQSPQVELVLADGLGSDPRLVDLVVERIEDMGDAAPVPTLPSSSMGVGVHGHAPLQDGGVAPSVGILLVKAGTRTQYDDCLWLAELGRMVEAKMGPGYAVDVAQSHYGDPTMESAAARLIGERGVASLICVPYIFFPGLILTRNVVGTLNRLQETYPAVHMTVAPPLGVDDRLIDVAADRVHQAWAKA